MYELRLTDEQAHTWQSMQGYYGAPDDIDDQGQFLIALGDLMRRFGIDRVHIDLKSDPPRPGRWIVGCPFTSTAPCVHRDDIGQDSVPTCT